MQGQSQASPQGPENDRGMRDRVISAAQFGTAAEVANQQGPAAPGTAPLRKGWNSHTSAATEWQSDSTARLGTPGAGRHCQLRAMTTLPDSNMTHTARTVLENTPASAGRQETRPAAFALTAGCFSGNLRSKIEHSRCFDSFWPYISFTFIMTSLQDNKNLYNFSENTTNLYNI